MTSLGGRFALCSRRSASMAFCNTYWMCFRGEYEKNEWMPVNRLTISGRGFQSVSIRFCHSCHGLMSTLPLLLKTLHRGEKPKDPGESNVTRDQRLMLQITVSLM